MVRWREVLLWSLWTWIKSAFDCGRFVSCNESQRRCLLLTALGRAWESQGEVGENGRSPESSGSQSEERSPAEEKELPRKEEKLPSGTAAGPSGRAERRREGE